jgi:hypothetical protein
MLCKYPRPAITAACCGVIPSFRSGELDEFTLAVSKTSHTTRPAFFPGSELHATTGQIQARWLT